MMLAVSVLACMLEVKSHLEGPIVYPLHTSRVAGVVGPFSNPCCMSLDEPPPCLV